MYAWAFKWRIIFGTFWVLTSLGSDILMPKLKGDVIDKLTEDQYADINTIFWYMVGFVVVSKYSKPPNHFFSSLEPAW